MKEYIKRSQTKIQRRENCSRVFKLVEEPKEWLFYQLMSIKMRNQLDANVLISLCPYVELLPPMVKALLNRPASRSTPIYYHIHRLASSKLMARNVSTLKRNDKKKLDFCRDILKLKKWK